MFIHCLSHLSITYLLLLLFFLHSFISSLFIINYAIINLNSSTLYSLFLSIYCSSLILTLTLIGTLIVIHSCFRYFDQKKLIALSSIIHLNLALISLLTLSSFSFIISLLVSLSHSLSSISLFLFSGLLINKSYSRYVDSLFFIPSLLRGILLLIILGNISFPGSINFITELLLLINAISIDYLLFIFIHYLVFGFLFLFIYYVMISCF